MIPALTNSKTVRVLDLSGNKIGDDGVAQVVKSLEGKEQQNLQALMLADNAITSKGALLIAKLYASTESLQELHL